MDFFFCVWFIDFLRVQRLLQHLSEFPPELYRIKRFSPCSELKQSVYLDHPHRCGLDNESCQTRQVDKSMEVRSYKHVIKENGHQIIALEKNTV